MVSINVWNRRAACLFFGLVEGLDLSVHWVAHFDEGSVWNLETWTPLLEPHSQWMAPTPVNVPWRGLPAIPFKLIGRKIAEKGKYRSGTNCLFVIKWGLLILFSRSFQLMCFELCLWEHVYFNTLHVIVHIIVLFIKLVWFLSLWVTPFRKKFFFYLNANLLIELVLIWHNNILLSSYLAHFPVSKHIYFYFFFFIVQF